jgi:hypothetical protein
LDFWRLHVVQATGKHGAQRKIEWAQSAHKLQTGKSWILLLSSNPKYSLKRKDMKPMSYGSLPDRHCLQFEDLEISEVHI